MLTHNETFAAQAVSEQVKALGPPEVRLVRSISKLTSPFLQPPQSSAPVQNFHTRSFAHELLLGTDVAVVATLSLAAVHSLFGELDVALSADHLLALELSGELSEIWGNLAGSRTAASESEDEVEGGLLLNVVV